MVGDHSLLGIEEVLQATLEVPRFLVLQDPVLDLQDRVEFP